MNIFNISASKIFVNSFIDGFQKRFDNSNFEFENVTLLFPNKVQSNLFEKEIKLLNNANIIKKIKHIYSFDSLSINDFKDENIKSDINLDNPLSLFEQESIFTKLILKYCKITNFAQATIIAKEVIFLMNEINKNKKKYCSFEDLNQEKFLITFREIIERYYDYLKLIKRSDPLEYLVKSLEYISNFLQSKPPKNPIIIIASIINNYNYLNFIKELSGIQNCYIILHALDKTIDNLEWESLELNHHQYSWKAFLEDLRIKPTDVIEWDQKTLENQTLINELFRSSATIEKWCCGTIKSNEEITINVLEVEDVYNEALTIVECIKNIITHNKNIFIATEDYIIINYLKKFLNFSDIEYQDFYSKGYKENYKFILFMNFIEILKDDRKYSGILSLFSHKKVSIKIFHEEYHNVAQRIISLFDKIPNFEINNLESNKYITDNISVEDLDLLKIVDFLIKVNKIQERDKKQLFRDYLESHIQIFDELLSDNKEEIFKEDLEGTKLFEFLSNLLSNSGSIEIDSFKEYVHYLEIAADSFVNQICIDNLLKVNFIAPQDIANFCGEIIIIPSFIDNLWPSKNKYSTTLVSQKFKNYNNIIDSYQFAGHVSYDLYKVFSSSQVIISRSFYKDAEYTTASRWLMRLKIVMNSYNLINNIYGFEEFKNRVKFIDNDIKRQKINEPVAFPKIELRPKKITASSIEMLIKNPYAYYAVSILKLNKNADIYSVNDNKKYGSFVHYILDYYTKNNLNIAEFTFNDFLQLVSYYFGSKDISKEQKISWYLKILNILNWFCEYNTSVSKENKIYTEVTGEYDVDVDGSNFKVFSRADRVIVNTMTNSIEIIDYKTGAIPKKIDTENLSDGAQLLVGAVIAKNNAFKIVDNLKSPNIKITYISLIGNDQPPKFKIIDFYEKSSMIEGVEKKLLEVLAYYNDSSKGYNSKTIYSDYKTDFDHFMRKKEWLS